MTSVVLVLNFGMKPAWTFASVTIVSILSSDAMEMVTSLPNLVLSAMTTTSLDSSIIFARNGFFQIVVGNAFSMVMPRDKGFQHIQLMKVEDVFIRDDGLFLPPDLAADHNQFYIAVHKLNRNRREFVTTVSFFLCFTYLAIWYVVEPLSI